jgi:HK97 family phage major capsid protein
MNLALLESTLTETKNRATALLERTKAQAASEQRVMTASEMASIKTLIDEAKGIKAKIDAANGDTAMLAELERLTGHASNSGTVTNSVMRSLGQQFVADPRHQEFIRQRLHHSSSAWDSPAVELKATTLTEGAGSGGALVLPHNLPGIVETATRELTVADLFARGQTDSNVIQLMREVSFTNNAAGVLEGGTKPESALVFEAATSPTRKIAHWIPLTTEILDDQAMVASYVDRRLRHGIELKLDDALVNGSGVDPILEGILARTGLATAVARGTDSNSDAIAKQIAAIETATLLPVDGIIMNPANWLAISLLKAADGTYISGAGPIGAPAPKMLWGRPVAVTPVIAAGTALVGSFQSAAQLFFRGGLVVRSSTSHANFFIENKVALLAELRANLVTFRNAAFGIVTGLTS